MRDFMKLVGSAALRYPSGVVRGLNLKPCDEPEAMLLAGELHFARLVAPSSMPPASLSIDFAIIQRGVCEYTERSMAKLDTRGLGRAYALLDQLCLQYTHDALQKVSETDTPLWHHKLLFHWMALQPAPAAEARVTVRTRVPTRAPLPHSPPASCLASPGH